MGNSASNRRIAKNTLMLYIRMLFLMLIGLYTSRVVLESLGVVDYGLYGVIGGLVSMSAIITGSLTAAISRFITFEMGRGKEALLSEVFSSAVVIQLMLSVIVLVVAEPLGLWFINSHMNVAEGRLEAVHWVFQFSLLSFIINIISTPYNALIVAHERMSAFAWIGIFEGFGKLGAALLIAFSPIDRLIFYSSLMALVAVAVRVAYAAYCRTNFEECRSRMAWNSGLVKKMLSFAGWNFIGVASGVLRDHGGNILINIFSGPVANAARSVSMQLGGAVQGFVTNFMTAVNPQITKSFASGDRNYMMTLAFKSSRLSFFLLFILSLPVMINIDFILNIWLKEIPAGSSAFVILALIFSMSECISSPLITMMLATGDIRNYQIVVGGLQILNFPISYLILKAGAPPESILAVAVVISQLCLAARLIMLRRMVGLPIGKFMTDVYFRIIAVAALSFVPAFFLDSVTDEGWGGFILSCMASISFSAIIIWLIGLKSDERKILISRITDYIRRRVR